MTETSNGPQGVAANAVPSSPPVASDPLTERLQALQASRSGAAAQPQQVAAAAAPTASRRPKPSGPAPSRILAAAASMSAGIGLIALMAGAQQDVVVQVNPTPVTIQPANIVVELPAASGNDASEVQVRVVEPATPVERSAPQARVATQSEGS